LDNFNHSIDLSLAFSPSKFNTQKSSAYNKKHDELVYLQTLNKIDEDELKKQIKKR